MKKLLTFLILSFTFVGCNSNTTAQYPTIQEKLTKMESYKSDVKLTYTSAKGDTIYETTQTADNTGRYKIRTSTPKEYDKNIVMFDGKMVWQYNPNLEDNQISINPPDKASRREMILFSFIENHVKSQDVALSVASLDNNACTVLEAKIPGANDLLSTEKLWIDNNSQDPIKLVIYDTDGNERIVAEFDKFEYNCKIDDDTFTIEEK